MALNSLCREIKRCTLCGESLPLGPNPVFAVGRKAKILIAGQAPGIRVHETGVPFNDPSGDRLREWMGVDRDIFYDPEKIALVPMGFCYPGTGKSGDLPPRPECARTWRQPLLDQLSNVRLTLAIGQYAIKWHLGGKRKPTLTETVRRWSDYGPDILPLPHPSPRNNIWLKKNPWFEEEVLPVLRERVKRRLG